MFDWGGDGASTDVHKHLRTAPNASLRKQRPPVRNVRTRQPNPAEASYNPQATPSSSSATLNSTSLSPAGVTETLLAVPLASVLLEAGRETSRAKGQTLLDDDFVDQMVDAFHETFHTACGVDSGNLAKPDNSAGSVQNDYAAAQELFCQIAANYARPLRSFSFALKRGIVAKDGIEFLRSALRTIGKAAEKMDMPASVKAINDFDEALALAQGSSQRLLDDGVCRLLLASYQQLAEGLPQVFLTGEEEQKLEDMIIRSLLQQIPGVGCVTLRKLYEAGLGSLHALLLVNQEDLKAATPIPTALCKKITDKFQQYRAEVQAISNDEATYRSRLARLIHELEGRHEELERPPVDSTVGPDWVNEKRERRKRREQSFLEILATLAELGDLDLIQRIQRPSFKQRIQRLKEHLATLEVTAGARS